MSYLQNTALKVIARSNKHRNYINRLSNMSGKYTFDVKSSDFLSLYCDTVYRLYETGFLFDDDPEWEYVRDLITKGMVSNEPNYPTLMSDTKSGRLTTRNRIIFPYVRRLVETQKAVIVTKRRVDCLTETSIPDDDILNSYQIKFNEFQAVGLF